MAIETERFVIKEDEVRAVFRQDSSYTHKEREKHNYSLEIFLYDRGSMMLEYEEDKAARDADFETIAAVIR